MAEGSVECNCFAGFAEKGNCTLPRAKDKVDIVGVIRGKPISCIPPLRRPL